MTRIYSDVRIQARPQRLVGGGWIALFYLIEDLGSRILFRRRCGQRTYPIKEAAVRAALVMGCRLIDEG